MEWLAGRKEALRNICQGRRTILSYARRPVIEHMGTSQRQPSPLPDAKQMERIYAQSEYPLRIDPT